MKVPILKRNVFVHIVEYRDRDMQTAICSGLPFKEPQYPFLDYDDKYVPEEWEWITRAYEYRRSLVIETSPEKYSYLSFSPSPIGIIAEIMFNSQCDKNHAQYLLKEGYVAIRVSRKKRKGYPKIIKEIVNMKGTNFYDFNKEKLFRYAIKKNVNIADILRDKKLLERLIKKGVDEI